MKKTKPVLLIEDNDMNATAVRRAFSVLEIPRLLVHSRNGEEAWKYLTDKKNTKPDFILLDLNMLRMNGIEFLKVIKEDPVLRRIPVVMLTTSDERHSINECFELNIAGYMVKPLDYEDLVDLIRIINLYWNYNELSNFEINDGMEVMRDQITRSYSK
jgi:CheY-like chemotaxis protein